jgi:hypothetical protein
MKSTREKLIELKLSLMTRTKTINTCTVSSGKQMKSNSNSWKCRIAMWIQDGNIALSLKLIEL